MDLIIPRRSSYCPNFATAPIIYAEEERAPLPDFSGPSLMEEGEEISLSDFEGEVVVLNAWGQWCAPCRAEVDDLQLVQETLDPFGGSAGRFVSGAAAAATVSAMPLSY